MRNPFLGVIPTHTFCLTVPVRQSLNTISLGTLLLFSFHLVSSLVVLGTLAALRGSYGLEAAQSLAAIALNVLSDAAMIWASLLLAWRDSHLMYMAWSVLAFLVQVLALAIALPSDLEELGKHYLVSVTSSRVIAGLDIYLLLAHFFFIWMVMGYFGLCVCSSYQISRLPRNYDRLVREELKGDYEKKREKVANKVYNEMVNEMYLSRLGI